MSAPFHVSEPDLAQRRDGRSPWPRSLLWALAAASIVFWVLRLATPADALAPPALASAPLAVDAAAVGRLLGAVKAPGSVAAAPDAASRFVLQGVIADTDGRGAALIAVDGKPARPFRVGASIGDSYVLQSVGTRAATLGTRVDAPVAFPDALKLPERPMAIPSRAPGVAPQSAP